MNELSTTPHGRLLSIAIAVALLGGGISATIHDPMGVFVMCVSLLCSVVLTLTAIALSIEHRPAFGILAAVILPFLFFLYAVGLGVVHLRAPWGAYGFIGLGAFFAILALRGKRAPSSTHHTSTPAGAH